MKNLRFLLLFLLLFLIGLVGCNAAEEPTPTAVVPPTIASTVQQPTAVANPADPVWERIQSNGKLVVGTSAGYPPFEYYNDNYQLDGFDIALMKNIAAELGLAIEFKDMAFDGLGSSLQLGEIDVAIAAITMTPEREGVVDFSYPYYTDSAAILAQSDSTITIASTADLSSRRIGVQMGTVYETWVNENLVDTGLTPPQNVFVYRATDFAINDLLDGRIDLVIADLLPAQVAAENLDVKVVLDGLDEAPYAIAMPQGTPVLQSEINRALTILDANGSHDALAQQYLQISDLPPIVPSQPLVPIEPPAVTCINSMAFVEHLTYDDNNMTSPPQFAPGAPFIKGWKVRNSGTCPWDSSYQLNYIGGNTDAARMNGRPTTIGTTVQPGETYDVYVDLISPLISGVYQGFWAMQNVNGEFFGERVWTSVQVIGLPTVTPAPTQTASPLIFFTVSQTSINSGDCVIFQWETQNVQASYFYPRGELWEQNMVPPKGNQRHCPTRTTTYELRVVNQSGSVEIRQITVYVNNSAPEAPTIYQFTADPSQIAVGQCVNLRWQVAGQVEQVSVKRNDTTLWDPAPFSGYTADCPSTAGQINYTLTATGPSGTVQKVETVYINDTGSVVPTSTPVPNATSILQPPVINYFTVAPAQIRAGQCVNVSWGVGGGTNYVRILRNGSVLYEDIPINVSAPDCLADPGTYVYRLEARNANRQEVAQEQTITVTAP